MLNLVELRRDLLIAIRGKRTQGQLSQRLGFKFNQVYRWESGTTKISWLDFVKLCEVAKAPLSDAVVRAFLYHGELSDVPALVQHFGGNNPKQFVAKSIGVSRYALSRWSEGDVCPSLEQMLGLMDFGSAEFYPFLENLVGAALLPSIADDYVAWKKRRRAFEETPWLPALLSAIDLEAYRSGRETGSAWLEEKTRLERGLLRETIERMEKADLISRENGIWKTNLEKLSAQGLSPDARRRLVRFWNARILDYLDASFGSKRSRNGFKVFSLTAEDFPKVVQRYTEFFNDLAAIINGSQKKADKIYLFNVNLIDFEDLPSRRKI